MMSWARRRTEAATDRTEAITRANTALLSDETD